MQNRLNNHIKDKNITQPEDIDIDFLRQHDFNWSRKSLLSTKDLLLEEFNKTQYNVRVNNY